MDLDNLFFRNDEEEVVKVGVQEGLHRGNSELFLRGADNSVEHPSIRDSFGPQQHLGGFRQSEIRGESADGLRQAHALVFSGWWKYNMDRRVSRKPYSSLQALAGY